MNVEHKKLTTVIFHSADFDGIFCREIARKFLPDAELIGWDFGDPSLEIPDGKLYVMDLPVDRVFGMKFPTTAFGQDLSNVEKAGDWSDVVWIDHHASSIASHPTNIPGYRIDGVAACRLAWQWFAKPKQCCERDHNHDGNCDRHPNGKLPDRQDFIDRAVLEPLAVRLAGEYDIWDKRDDRAELFQHGLKSQPLGSFEWELLLESRNTEVETHDPNGIVNTLLKAWACLQYARSQEYEEVIKQQGFNIFFEGLTFLACNSHELDIRSHLFAAGIKPHHDALLGFTFSGKDWRVSMYHAPGKEHYDLSQIAIRYGGGGHRGACGFRAKKLPWL